MEGGSKVAGMRRQRLMASFCAVSYTAETQPVKGGGRRDRTSAKGGEVLRHERCKGGRRGGGEAEKDGKNGRWEREEGGLWQMEGGEQSVGDGASEADSLFMYSATPDRNATSNRKREEEG